MSFAVNRVSGAEPDTAEISIWGTDAEIRNAAQKKGAPLDIEAGYEENFGLLFKGNVRRTFFTTDGVETELRIEAGDGDTALGGTLRQQSFPPHITFEKIVTDMINALGVSAKDAIDKVKKLLTDNGQGAKQKQKGFSISGLASESLNSMLKRAGITYAIQDGTMIVAETGKPSENFATAIKLTPTSGLIGSPEQGEGGSITVTSLLQPGIRPHRQLQIDSASVKGAYVIEKVTHRGDTHGQEWYSVAEAREFK